MTGSRVRYRKIAIKIHLVSISLWMISSLFILLGAILHAETWTIYIHKILLNPSHMIAMASGIYLIYLSRGKLFKKSWFLVKIVLLLSSVLLMNIGISNFISESKFNSLLFVF